MGLIAIGLAGAWRMGTALVEPAPRTIGAAPADLVALDVTIPSASGSMLHGWWMEADAQREVTRSRELEGQTEVAQQHSTEARAPSSSAAARATIVLLHPLRGDRRAMLGRARFLLVAGYDVLLIDLQAHGMSSGGQVTAGWLERLDAQAAIAFAKQQAPNQKLAVIGWSLGGAATLLAHGTSESTSVAARGPKPESIAPSSSQALPSTTAPAANGMTASSSPEPSAKAIDPAADAEPITPQSTSRKAAEPTPLAPGTLDVLVLESVYPTITEAIRDRIAIRLGPLAWPLTPLLTLQLPMRLGCSAADLRPIDHIASVGCPVLVLAGDADEQTPAAETKRLFETAVEPKQLEFFQGAEHTDLHRFDRANYEATVLAFLNASL